MPDAISLIDREELRAMSLAELINLGAALLMYLRAIESATADVMNSKGILEPDWQDPFGDATDSGLERLAAHA